MSKLTQLQISLIKQTISEKNGDIVRISIPNETTFSEYDANSNIYMISSENEIIWQIRADKGNIAPLKIDPFVSLKFKDNILKAQRFSGNEYLINITTGKATQVDWNK